VAVATGRSRVRPSGRQLLENLSLIARRKVSFIGERSHCALTRISSPTDTAVWHVGAQNTGGEFCAPTHNSEKHQHPRSNIQYRRLRPFQNVTMISNVHALTEHWITRLPAFSSTSRTSSAKKLGTFAIKNRVARRAPKFKQARRRARSPDPAPTPTEGLLRSRNPQCPQSQSPYCPLERSANHRCLAKSQPLIANSPRRWTMP
jgi:hypothetical protein